MIDLGKHLFLSLPYEATRKDLWNSVYAALPWTLYDVIYDPLMRSWHNSLYDSLHILLRGSLND
jgi:hypothetical protein